MTYSPKIKEELVRKLYLLKQIEQRPITVLANEAINQYLNKKPQLNRKEYKNER